MNPWHPVLHDALRGRALPVLDFGDAVIPAASVWTAARGWVQAFRSAGLAAGDRVVLCLPPSPAFLAVLVAGLWEGLTVAVADPAAPAATALERFDARLAVGGPGGEAVAVPRYSNPPEAMPALRTSRTPPTPQACLLLRTSGTSGAGKAVALTARGVLSVLESHLPRMEMHDAVVASVLPWHHSFGLVLELLASVVARAVVVRVPTGGRDPTALLTHVRDRGVTHLSGVPLMFKRILELPDGDSFLRTLRGGIVGGAPVSERLATRLAGTRLCPGYGQTEASPGVTLGEPGVWRRGLLGRAVGCEVKLTPRGTLAFRGDNAFAGYFDPDDGGLQTDTANRLDGGWVDTGDVVEQTPQGWVYLGRDDDTFKLSNGRRVEAGRVEAGLCRTLPGVDDAVVFTDDGERLFVALDVADGATMPHWSEVEAAMGSLGAYLAGVFPLPKSSAVRTAKGAVDRRGLMHLAGAGRAAARAA